MTLSTTLSNEALLQELDKRPGLIPTNINSTTRQVTWTDMGKYHFYEGFLDNSVDIFNNLQKENAPIFTTDWNVLLDDSIVKEFIYPSGFIFHVGRCGSTLLVKALARSRQNLVLSEPAPLNQILYGMADQAEIPLAINETNKKIYRNLVLALLRKRVDSHRQSFIKFTSYNVRFFDLIHSVFPDVPALFLSRNTDDVIASFEKARASYMKDTPQKVHFFTGIENLDDIAGIVGSISQSAVKYPDTILKKVDYDLLKPENLTFILSYFNYCPNETDLVLMKKQFQYYSKVNFNKQKFEK